MPSVWEPTFRVRDFGPGMPHEFMMGKYTVAFHSEKDDTNNQVGASVLAVCLPLATQTTTPLSLGSKGLNDTTLL